MPSNNPNINYTHNEGIAPQIQDYYNTTLLSVIHKDCVYLNADLNTKVLPKGQSGTAKFRRILALSPISTPLKEGVTPDGKKLKFEEFSATIAPYGDYIEMTDEMDWRVLDDMHKASAEVLAKQSAESIDDIAKKKLGAGLNVRYPDGITKRADITKTHKLTAALIQKVVRDLKKNGAKPFADGSYHGICDTNTAFDLRQDPMFIDVAKYQDGEKFNQFEIGKIAGVRFTETNNGLVYKDDAELMEGIAYLEIEKYESASKTIFLKSSELSKITMELRRVLAGKLVNFVDNAGTKSFTATIDRVNPDGTITLRYEPAGMAAATWTGGAAEIKPTGGGKSGAEVYGTLIYGANYGAKVGMNDGAGKPKTIIKPLGSSGTEDPLNQRGTIAWKVDAFTVTILEDMYITRVEHGVSD